jgi:hypothetical protein
MNNIIITVDLHTSGAGFQVVADINGECKGYPEPIEDIKEALDKAFILRDMIEWETGEGIPDKDVRVTQRAIEYNAMTTPDNMKVYRNVMTGKVKSQF